MFFKKKKKNSSAQLRYNRPPPESPDDTGALPQPFWTWEHTLDLLKNPRNNNTPKGVLVRRKRTNHQKSKTRILKVVDQGPGEIAEEHGSCTCHRALRIQRSEQLSYPKTSKRDVKTRRIPGEQKPASTSTVSNHKAHLPKRTSWAPPGLVKKNKNGFLVAV